MRACAFHLTASQGKRLLRRKGRFAWGEVSLPAGPRLSPPGGLGAVALPAGCQPCCRAPGAAMDAHSQGRGQCQGIPPAPEGGHPGVHDPARGGRRTPPQQSCTAQPRPYGAPGCPSRQGIAAEQERRKTSIWQEGSCLTSWPGTQAAQENVHWKKRCLKDIWEDRLLSPVFLLSVITCSIK